MLLFVVTVQTTMLFDKVRLTYQDHILTFDLNIPTWPFAAVAWLGDVSAVLLIAVRTYRLIFHPEDIHDAAQGHRLVAELSPDVVAVIGFVALFALMLLRVPVGMAMGLVGVTGYGYLTGSTPGAEDGRPDIDADRHRLYVRRDPDVPADGRDRDAFRHEPGDVSGGESFRRALARRSRHRDHRGLRGVRGDQRFVGGDGGDVLHCRVSGNAAVQLSAIVRHRRDRRGRNSGRDVPAVDRSGCVWTDHTAGHRQVVCRRHIAGTSGCLDVHAYHRGDWPGPPRMAAHGAGERLGRRGARALRDVWAPVLLFLFVIGGLYGGLFTPTEAGGMGAVGALLISVARGRLSRADLLESLLQATRTAAAVFTVLIGAILFGYFLTVTQTPQKVTEFITGLGLSPHGALILIMLMYLVLGCLMDAMAMIILTVPIIFPVIQALGVRSGVVWCHHRDDGRAWAYSSSGRNECVRDQDGGEGRQFLDDFLSACCRSW